MLRYKGKQAMGVFVSGIALAMVCCWLAYPDCLLAQVVKAKTKSPNDDSLGYSAQFQAQTPANWPNFSPRIRPSLSKSSQVFRQIDLGPDHGEVLG